LLTIHTYTSTIALPPKSGNSHFQVILSYQDMEGMSRIQIHKKIYSELKEEMNDYVHSLEITLED